MNNQELYQKLYDDPKRKYGQAEFDRCPGVRLIPKYKEYLYGIIIDFGCGTGDTVEKLNDMNFNAIGYDFINRKKHFCYKDDITKPFGLEAPDVGLCIDVIEHIADEPLKGLFENLKKCGTQIISIHNGPSTEGGGVELHINKKSFSTWERILKGHFEVKKKIKIHNFQMLYICERGK